jgi:hypothetical protein
MNRKKAQDRTAGMGALGFGDGATDKDRAEDEANTTSEGQPAFTVPVGQPLTLQYRGFKSTGTLKVR